MEGPPDLRVLIVGAGIGGLLLAILLDRAGITYQVIERATTFKPLGSSMSLPAAVQPLLEQLGLLDEINEVSKPERNICFYDQELTLMGTADALFSRERYGYYIRVMSRPALYSILLKRIPKDRITLSKRVIGVEQSDSRVTVRCADNSVYEADIVVGADGAYSAVRQNMYRDLAQKQQLPSADAKPMAFDQECVVGTTEPLDPEKFPIVKEEFTSVQIVLSVDHQYAFWAMPTEDNRVSWMICHQLSAKDFRKQETFKSSEWGPEVAEEICSKVRHFPCPSGGKMGDIIDSTRTTLRSRVFLEEKFFKTWMNGRVVLIGDACHKVVPHAAQGATQAMFDALSLANHLSELQHNTVDAISNCFRSYYNERKKYAKAAVQDSRQVSSMLSNQGWAADIARRVSFNYMSDWLMRLMGDKINHIRPQAIFLDQVPDRGSYRAKPISTSPRAIEYRRIRKQRIFSAQYLARQQSSHSLKWTPIPQRDIEAVVL